MGDGLLKMDKTACNSKVNIITHGYKTSRHEKVVGVLCCSFFSAKLMKQLMYNPPTNQWKS